MDSVNKTLYIPLYGKAYVSRRSLFLRDESAERIWGTEGFPLRGKAKSKWLAYYMGMRSAVFDRWLQEKKLAMPGAVILHLGCGLDGRVHRVGTGEHKWLDVDFPDVMAQRKVYFQETDHYRMVPADIRQKGWLEAIAEKDAIVVMEGISMYLTNAELTSLLDRLSRKFRNTAVLMDSYTVFAAKATKYKNPINEVGVTEVFGFDDPEMPVTGTGLSYVQEHSLTPEDMILELPRREQPFFRLMYAGKIAGKIYRLYEYKKGTD